MTLFYFLYKNGYWISTSPKKIYDFACFVSESDPREKDIVLDDIRGFISTKIKKRKIVSG